MTPVIRDRARLFTAAFAVVLCTLTVGYISDALGFGSMGLLVIIETVLVFGAALSYSHTAWPQWYRRPRQRRRIVMTYVVLVALHTIVTALAFEWLRFESGMWVWIGIGVGEVVCIVVALTAVVTNGNFNNGRDLTSR